MGGFRQQWHWFDYILIAMRTLWFVLGVIYIQTNTDIFYRGNTLFETAGFIWLVLMWHTVVYLIPLVLFVNKKLPRLFAVLAELILSGSFFCLIAANLPNDFGFYNFPVLMLGYMSTGRLAPWAAIGSLIVLPALAGWGWRLGAERTVSTMVDVGILYSIGFCFQKMITSFHKNKEMYAIIEKQNQTLEIYSRQIERLTLYEERNRLARELHDTVGHTFTTTIMGMDAVYYLIDNAPEEAKTNLRELLHVTRNGLDEVRRHIHQIAPDKEERSLSGGLAKIANEFALHTGTNVELKTAGKECPVSENIRLTMIRCLQESLTNAKKHGMASSIHIELSFQAGFIGMKIADNGSGSEQIVEGFGLRGMSERIANLGGTLEVTSSPEQGTVIACKIPVQSNPSLSINQEGA